MLKLGLRLHSWMKRCCSTFLIPTSTLLISIPFQYQNISNCDNIICNNTQIRKINQTIIEKSIIKRVIANIKSFYATLKHLFQLLFRCFFLGIVFSPPIMLSPLLLIFSEDSVYHKYWWNLFLQSISISGPCYTKFSQWASTRVDLFPLKLCNEFKQLQANNIKYSTSQTLANYEMSINKDIRNKIEISRNLKTNECIIIGSGCIAQVIKGKLLSTNQDIAIKIVHPNIINSINLDLQILQYITQIIEFIPFIKILSLNESMNQFADLMINQLNMNNEAQNLLKFHKNFQSNNNKLNSIFLNSIINFINKLLFNINNNYSINFPQPIYVNDNILIETYESGLLMNEYLTLNNTIENININNHLAKIGLNSILKMIFLDNFVHADLHPGNIIIQNYHSNDSNTQNIHNSHINSFTNSLEMNNSLINDSKMYDSSNNNENIPLKLCYIDAGIIAELSQNDYQNFLDLFYYVIKNNGKLVGKLMIERSNSMNVIDKEGFMNSMDDIIKDLHSHGLSLGN